MIGVEKNEQAAKSTARSGDCPVLGNEQVPAVIEITREARVAHGESKEVNGLETNCSKNKVWQMAKSCILIERNKKESISPETSLNYF